MKIVVYLVMIVGLIKVQAQEVVFFEDFSGGELPAGWSIIDNDGYTVHPSVAEFSDAWIVLEEPGNSGNFIAGSTSYFQPVDRADRWLITPPVELGAGGNFISWYARSQDPSFPDSYQVLLSTSGAAMTDFTEVIVTLNQENPSWIKRDFQIDDELANETVRFAIRNNTFNGFKLYIDSVEVRKDDPLSNQNLSLKKSTITAYPNPTTDMLHVKGVEGSQLTLLNLNGQIVKKVPVGTYIIPLDDLPAGIYMLQVVSANEVQRLKIVKQ